MSTFDPPSQPPRPRLPRLGVAALVIALVAAVGSVVSSAVVGSAVGPIEAIHGPVPLDAHPSIVTAALGLLGSQLFWGGLGLVALVLGVVAAATRRTRSAGIAGIVVAGLFPLVSLGVLLGMVTSAAPIG